MKIDIKNNGKNNSNNENKMSNKTKEQFGASTEDNRKTGQHRRRREYRCKATRGGTRIPPGGNGRMLGETAIPGGRLDLIILFFSM